MPSCPSPIAPLCILTIKFSSQYGPGGDFQKAVGQVAELCAVAAMTAPKSGGQLFLKGSKPFIETVIVEDRATLARL